MSSNAALKPVENIAFIDLAAQQARIKDKIDNALSTVLAHGKYIMGPEVQQFEADLGSYTGAKHTISCSSGTDALVMALMALGVQAGDAVFVPSFTFAATAEAVAILGAIPVFVDVDAKNYNIDLSSLEAAYETNAALNHKAVGIIAVDLFGLPANYEALNSFAEQKGLWVMADSAQSLGGRSNNQNVGQMARVTTTSFFPAKPLGCYGDGGAIFTDDDDLAAKLRSIRVHGKGNDKYDNVRLGVNGRLDTLQAAILIEKLKIFPEEIVSRNRVAAYYNENLSDIIQTPFKDDQTTCAWAQYTLQLSEKNRQYVLDQLKAAGVPTAVYYPLPLHQQTCYKDYPSAPDMGTCEKLSQTVFSLPMHPYLKPDTQDYIIQEVRKALT